MTTLTTVSGLADLAAKGTTGGETTTFWILAPMSIITAIAMVFLRSAVHSALMLVANFLILAVFYAQQEAPFLAAVQVIVYTGAIMVLFLFVIMIVGIDTSDSLVETIRGQRLAAGVVGIGFALLLAGALGHAVSKTTAVGLGDATSGTTNVAAIAKLLFTDYFFPFEIVSALLIIAAVGAMVLGHREREGARRTQRDIVTEKFAGTHPLPQLGATPPLVAASVAAAPAPTVIEAEPTETSDPTSTSAPEE